ncbi:hypothetical protein [Acidisphaera sp. S103]|uniref:hypothetical protein n=1 Tax=Acidisphaera sp. S103 TaxID=1747223 RepID=UPI00131DC5A9|nr:hypothetical protein [Acidisphaera sp. S103]
MLNLYRLPLIKLYQRVHELEADRIGNRLLALEIQEELLQRIVRAEARIRRRRDFNARTKFELSKRDNSRDTSNKLRTRHARGIDYVRAQKTLIKCLRSIGDAVAFIYGDRYELKQLVNNGDPGFISGKRGTRLERMVLRKSFRWGATVVMNDLTNTLRHGDITVFNPDLWPDGGSPISPVEIKSGRGGNKKRAARQIQALADVMKYIRTDSRRTEDGVQMRVPPNEEIRRYDGVITRLVRDLPRRGWATEEVERGLYYIIIDGESPRVSIPEAFHFLGGKENHRWVFISSNKIRNEILGYYPFPLLIHHSEGLYRFYNGEFVINVAVDITHLNEIIFPKGVSIEPEQDGWWRLNKLDPDDMWGERYISSRTVGLLGAEFASLRWFIDNIVLGCLNTDMNNFMSEQTKPT